MADDNYLDKIVKYIPSEIVAGYVALSGAIESAKDTIPFHTVQWYVVAGLLILTPLYILRFARLPGSTSLPVYQAIASSIAFICWVFALSNGPFTAFDWYRPVYGTIVLVFFTLVAPLGEGLFP